MPSPPHARAKGRRPSAVDVREDEAEGAASAVIASFRPAGSPNGLGSAAPKIHGLNRATGVASTATLMKHRVTHRVPGSLSGSFTKRVNIGMYPGHGIEVRFFEGGEPRCESDRGFSEPG